MRPPRYILWLARNDNRTIFHGRTPATALKNYFPATPLAYRLCRPTDRDAYIKDVDDPRYLDAFHDYRRSYL